MINHKPLLLLTLLVILCLHLCSTDIYGFDKDKLSIRLGGQTFWNEGWKMKFYYHTFSDQDIINGNLDFNRTLRHTTYINPEIWYEFYEVRKVSFDLVAKYEHLEFTLNDSINFSFLREHKSLDANLNMFSLGIRAKINTQPSFYLGFNSGYCFGDLRTIQHIDRRLNHVEGNKTTVWLDGDGGGLFYELLGGVVTKVKSGFGIFIEGGLRFTPGWEEFSVDQVYGDDEQYGYSMVTENERRLDRMLGFLLSLGLQYDL